MFPPSLPWKINSLSLSSAISAMDSSSAGADVAYDLSPFIIIYKDGRIKRLSGVEVVPPSLDPKTNVESKDVVISKEPDISARLFLPKTTNPDQKLPLFIYFHGGGFVIETPFAPNYHNYLNSVASQANVIGVSVHYRRAPEDPVPIAFEDSWASLRWVASHFGGNGPDEWLNRHADFDNAFFAGDSAGANISHHMAIRVGKEGLEGLKLKGVILVHPYFWGVEPIGSEKTVAPERRSFADRVWRFACPKTSGSDDPFINPAKDPNLGSLGCERLLVCIAEKDLLKDRGWYYKELVEKSGWNGSVEAMEAEGEEHVFHLHKPTCENAVAMLDRIVSFINQP